MLSGFGKPFLLSLRLRRGAKTAMLECPKSCKTFWKAIQANKMATLSSPYLRTRLDQSDPTDLTNVGLSVWTIWHPFERKREGKVCQIT